MDSLIFLRDSADVSEEMDSIMVWDVGNKGTLSSIFNLISQSGRLNFVKFLEKSYIYSQFLIY